MELYTIQIGRSDSPNRFFEQDMIYDECIKLNEHYYGRIARNELWIWCIDQADVIAVDTWVPKNDNLKLYTTTVRYEDEDANGVYNLAKFYVVEAGNQLDALLKTWQHIEATEQKQADHEFFPIFGYNWEIKLANIIR